MRQKINFIGVCLAVLMVLSSANAATKYLEWSFEDVVTQRARFGGPYVDCIVNLSTTADGTGNGRNGQMGNTGWHGWQPGDPLPAIIEDSPYGVEVDGDAVHFRADDTVQRVRALASTGLDIDATTFSGGISARMIWQFDEESTQRVNLINVGGPAGGDRILMVKWYGDSVDEHVTVYTKTTTDITRYITPTRAAIETATGHSMVGSPTVFTATYSGTEIALYADGIKVASETYVASLPPVVYNRIEVGNSSSSNAESRKGFVDEVCVWPILHKY